MTGRARRNGQASGREVHFCQQRDRPASFACARNPAGAALKALDRHREIRCGYRGYRAAQFWCAVVRSSPGEIACCRSWAACNVGHDDRDSPGAVTRPRRPRRPPRRPARPLRPQLEGAGFPRTMTHTWRAARSSGSADRALVKRRAPPAAGAWPQRVPLLHLGPCTPALEVVHEVVRRLCTRLAFAQPGAMI